MVAAIITMAGLLIAGTSAAADWPVDSFQVVAREPDIPEVQKPSGQGVGEGAEGTSSRQEAEVPEAAAWLNEISSFFQLAGHKPPALGPVINTAGTEKYRAYIFPYPGSRTRDGYTSSASYEANTCQTNNKIPWLSVNHDNTGGSLKKMNYMAFAHEMMHALQYGDRLLDQCSHDPFWFTEGIANGAGMLLTFRKFPREISHRDRSASAVGLRSYRIPLTHTSGQKEKTLLDLKMGYGAGSLWFFIAERFGGLKVYPHFLKRVITRGMSSADQMKWFDEGLQSLPGLATVVPAADQRRDGNPSEPPGTYEVFPAFLTEFASYGGERYMAFAGVRHHIPEAARERWLQRGFGGCRQIDLSPSAKVQQIPFSLFQNAAICLNLRYTGFTGNVRTRLEVLSKNLRMLDQFHLGWAWKIGPDGSKNCYKERKKLNSKWPPCVYKIFSQTGPQPGVYARTWPTEDIDFGEGAGKTAERILILSNVAVKPWLTKITPSLTLKVGVSASMANGKPTEPVDQMPVPRKKKVVNPNKPVGREELYGLQTDPPAPDIGVKGLSFNPYTPNRDKGAKARPGGYGVSFHNLEYGRTGEVTGIVALQPGDPRTKGGPVSSSLCKDPGKPIGEIIQSDEDALLISIDADLCQVTPGSLKQCENGCPVVDHLSAEATIAFGWRQFGGTAPTDIRTPGVQRYINTMPDSLQEAMNFGADTALPIFDGGAEGSATGSAGSASSQGAAGGSLAPCACTCEEWRATHDRAEQMKARSEAGEEISMSSLGELARCNSVCQREYMICTLEADRAREQQRELQQRQQAEAVVCDCSCEAISARMNRARQLEQQFKAGDSVSNEAVSKLSQCASKCQQQMLACAMNNQIN